MNTNTGTSRSREIRRTVAQAKLGYLRYVFFGSYTKSVQHENNIIIYKIATGYAGHDTLLYIKAMQFLQRCTQCNKNKQSGVSEKLSYLR